MHNQTTKLLLGVFVLLAVIAVFPYLKKQLQGDEKPNAKNISVSLSSFTNNSVEKISIKKGSDQKTLSFKDNLWQINDEEADQDKVSNLFDDFQQLQIGNVVSQNADNHTKFGVTPEDSIQLTFSQSGKDTTFYVGKAGAAVGTFYLRKDGIKTVYQVTSPLRDKLLWDVAKWKKSDEATDGETDANPLDTDSPLQGQEEAL